MPGIRRFAFLYRPPDGGREEWETASENLTAEEAVDRFYESHPEAEIVKPLRGQIPDGLDLSRSEAEFVTENSDEDEPKTASVEEGVDVTEVERVIEEEIDADGVVEDDEEADA